MGLFDFFTRGGKTISDAELTPIWSERGVEIRFAREFVDTSTEGILEASQDFNQDDSLLAAYLAQLAIEQICEIESRSVFIPWNGLYKLFRDTSHTEVVDFLRLPLMCDLRPVLENEGTLSEPGFEVTLAKWTDGNREVRVERRIGAVVTVDGTDALLSEAAWATATEIGLFRERPPSDRTQHANELAWGRIRRVADQAGAMYASPYLETTYVVTPETLRLPMVKEETPFGRVITVNPTFAQAPDGWLKAFDGFNSVQSHYDLTRGAGRVRIVISEPVRRVLEVIKRDMPGRRVSGSRAEKFVHNPWAFLGESAHEVIREDEFAEDRGAAGAVASVFSIVPRMGDGRLNSVDLVVTEHFSNGSAQTNVCVFTDTVEFEKFIACLEIALIQDRERFPWEEYDLSVDADSALQLETSRQFLSLWKMQPAERISFLDIYELDGYSGRIEGIGAAKPIYVPVLQKPSNDGNEASGWMPADLTPMVRVTLQGHEGQILVPLTKKWVEGFEKQVSAAEGTGTSEVKNESLPSALATGQARSLVDSFHRMLGAQDRVKGDSPSKSKEKRPAKETLLVKTNFHGVDYAEERKSSLALPEGAVAHLPKSLRAEIGLKKHQLYGIAWFQHLVSRSPGECRGALLADDMGLGKTLQLLTLLGWYYEHSPNAEPSIIFAPKSLLENWKNETTKFFTPSFPEVLVLHGEKLRSLKQPLGLIDEQLKTKGVIELLKPNWVGNAKLIVTTYEVLTSYEFSLARQPFAFVICDEAQRIKTPGTLVTLAAKKLKADFRVACTGTPVENSLADLWCLFDFVQPGLLGALEEFGKTYRKPIECETAEQKSVLARLQMLIAPQTLRRTKVDIAHELKRKLFGYKCATEITVQFKERLDINERLEIPISEHQRILYKGGLKKLQDASKENDGRKRARLSFGALHLMKAVCAEPYCLPGSKFLPEKQGRNAHLANSPKLDWMLKQLEQVKAANEKAIIFTELREAQAALSYFLRETFHLKPFVINGDSDGRQAYIDKFSANEGFDVIILSTLAAGAGLNVTAANHVFHFTRAWNAAKEAQATDRAFRIGQARDVHVYCPTVVADDFHTFEVRLDELLRKKSGLADSTLDGDGMAVMLNGSGQDATFTELVGQGVDGAELPRSFLTMNDIDRLDGFGFEVFCSLLWTKRGFQAKVTEKRGGDGGIDVIAIKGRDGELLQCKSSINSQIGWDAIKEATAGAAKYQAHFAGTRFRKVAVTNQQFSAGAVEQASANQVFLVMRKSLEELLGVYPITNHELDAELIASTCAG
jgi:SNF2-related domain/Restriction endonuclease/Helicase conserved C-terminal domain